MSLPISLIATASGTNPPTIRYYESIGLLAPAERTPKGRRVYARSDVERLTFIRRARGFGLSIQQVRELLAASDAGGATCLAAASLIEAHLITLRRQRSELRFLEDSLRSILKRCEATCATEGGSDCSIIGDITTSVDTSRR